MLKKNISTDDLFYYIPKSNSLTRNKKEKIPTNTNTKYPAILGKGGSSTFDYLNDINRNKFKFPKIKDPFLTKNLRNKKIMNKIEKKILYKVKQ